MIGEILKKEINEFNNKDITIVKGFSFNQRKIIETIYHYYNSNYSSGKYDSEGFRKYFYNIVRVPCNVATKAVDFDTKDIRLLTAGGGNPIKTWFFEKDLKFWMKDKNFGKILNRTFYELPIFGSVVWKIINNKIYFIDLRNFIIEQNADSLKQSNYIIEIHRYTSQEFRRIGKEKGWSNTSKVIQAFRKSKKKYITIYERYGELPLSEINGGDPDTYSYSRAIVAVINDEDLGKDKFNNEIYLDVSIFDIDEIPYREFHWEKIPGRWLGIGRVEILIDPQIRTNEIINLRVKSSYWSTLRLFQIRGDVERNLLTETKNGEVLSVESEIIPVPTEERNLTAYTVEENEWLRLRDELGFSHDILRGERLPAGTPLGSAQLAVGMASAYFDIIRENIALDVKEILYNDIIPQFKKESKAEHVLRLTGEDLDNLNNLFIEARLTDDLLNYINTKKRIPPQEVVEIMRAAIAESIKKQKERLIVIPDSFYEDVKYKIDIIITGEQEDTRIQAANLQMALQAIIADPSVLENPVKKKILFKILEKGGISPIDLETTSVPSLVNTIQQLSEKRGGGGVSKPTIPNLPIRQSTENTL